MFRRASKDGRRVARHQPAVCTMLPSARALRGRNARRFVRPNPPDPLLATFSDRDASADARIVAMDALVKLGYLDKRD
jgi:hypothetical protein